ncbi:MAG: structural protein [Stellaceae bacterium]
MSDLVKAPTRGEKNVNPGNIRFDLLTQWVGQTGRDDSGFCLFDRAEHGIRALCRVLLNYQRLDGCRTLEDVVRRYAPRTENDTGAYLADVLARTGIGASQPLDLEHPGELANVARAIIFHENGRCIYDAATIAKAVALALQS